ncbi:MAG: hypothetical protein ACM3PW_01180 [Chlamydiota bacterium]
MPCPRVCMSRQLESRTIAYNWSVDKPATRNSPGKPESARSRLSAERRRALRAETIGIIVIALAILLYTVARYGSHINWSAR